MLYQPLSSFLSATAASDSEPYVTVDIANLQKINVVLVSTHVVAFIKNCAYKVLFSTFQSIPG